MANSIGGQVVWDLDVDSSRFDSGLTKAKLEADSFGRDLSKVGDTAGRNFGQSLGGAFSSIATGLGQLVKGVAVTAAASSLGFGAMIGAALDQQKAVENAGFALRAYEKDAGAVNRVLSDLVKFATSPLGTLFQREDLFKAASNLKVFGDQTAKLTDHIEIMARVVALGFTNFDELSLILGRVGAAGHLTGVDFDLLTARGVKLPDTMRNAAVSFDQLFTAVSNAIPAGILEGRADSIDGRLIRLKSSFRNLGAAILGIDRDTNTFVKGGLGDRLLKLLDDLRVTLASPAIKEAFTGLGKSVASFAEKALPLVITAITFLARNINTIAPAFIALATAWAAASVAGVILGIVFGPITLGAFALAAGITGVIAVVTFLQVRFGIFQKAIELVKVGFGHLKDAAGAVVDFLGKARDVAADFANGALTWLKGRIDDLKGAFEAIKSFLEDHRKGLEQIAGVITVVLGPAFLKLAVQAGIAAAQMVASAVVAAAEWVAQAVVAGVAWTIQFAIMTAKAIANAVVQTAQAIVAGAIWVAQAVVAGAAWVLQFGIMIAKAIATAVVFVAQAAIGGYAWLIGAAIAAPAWIAAFAVMSAQAIAHAAVSAAQAVVAAAAWIVQFALMAARAVATAAVFVVQAAISSGAWVVSAVVAGAAWLLEFGLMIAGAVAAAGAMLVAAIQAGIAWLIALGPIGLIIAAVAAIAAAAFLVIKNWDAVKNFFGGLGHAVLSAIGSFIGLLYNAGRDLIQGLLNGAGSLLSSIGRFFLDKVPSFIREPFKKALGIGSPSKLFAGYGENIAEGLMLGLKGSQKMIDATMGNLVVAPTVAGGGGDNISNRNLTMNVTNNNNTAVDNEIAMRELGYRIMQNA